MELLPIVIDALPTSADGQVFTRERQAGFLAALAEGGEVRRAAGRAGVSHATAYRERRASPAFRRAWDAALLAARVHAEQVLATRALEGVEEEVWYHGEVVATRRRYDSRLLLAHLGRLDRLCADARTEAFADDFEAALARFERGEEAVPEVAQDSGAQAANGEGGFFAPGQCNTCHTAEEEDAYDEAEDEDDGRRDDGWDGDPCPDCGGRCLDDEEELTSADCQWLGNRLGRMDAARPRKAREPHEFPDHDAGEVEAEQLAAFEAGVARWWLVVPPDDDAPGAGAGKDGDAGADEGDGWVWDSDDGLP